MQKIRLIASDMDGTLLNSKVQISERTARALRAAQEKGVIVSLCTGRFAQFGAMMLNNVNVSGPVVGANGGSIWDDKQQRTISSHPIPAAIALQVNELLRSLDVYYYVFAADTIATSETGKDYPLSHYWHDQAFTSRYQLTFGNGREYTLDVVGNDRAIKFFVPRQPDDIHALISAKLKEIPGIYVTASGHNCFEIMKAGVNKRTGVEELAAMYGVDMENVMAFGDYHNDMPMIRAAGFGVAMGNALEEVKACADYVTDTNDNDGVAQAIERFVP